MWKNSGRLNLSFDIFHPLKCCFPITDWHETPPLPQAFEVDFAGSESRRFSDRCRASSPAPFIACQSQNLPIGCGPFGRNWREPPRKRIRAAAPASSLGTSEDVPVLQAKFVKMAIVDPSTISDGMELNGTKSFIMSASQEVHLV
ncbi:Hypothetical predicted protein [Cloeon dipterum]|uniref:Uncharacterized protein n=1 Tax=Cloeon dipterum TaxID=197152 RepID=A0A8S1D8J1_9INSE|nr:Hypothetical predicted protein [Cloeon dipterum]